MTDTKRIDDLVVLGRAAPEPIRDGRETVCLGGYSETVGYVRLYPTKRRMTELSRWNVISVPVESDDGHDNREESYKIAGSKKDWDILHKKVEKVGELNKGEQIRLVDRLAGDCTAVLNENRESLGIVEPRDFSAELRENNQRGGIQAQLTGGTLKGKNDYKYKLYLNYVCEGCQQESRHDQSTIEWGVYKYWDKNEDYQGVIDALGLTDNNQKCYFFVGNINNHRTAYIVISVLRFKYEDLNRNGVAVGSQNQTGLDDYV